MKRFTKTTGSTTHGTKRRTERPILFAPEMIRAILEGRKFQTRREMKPQPQFTQRVQSPSTWTWRPAGSKQMFPGNMEPELTAPSASWREDVLPHLSGAAGMLEWCPYGVVGDTLWVREAHYVSPKAAERQELESVVYMADQHATNGARLKWRPSIFMPRWASRITLKITQVRVERVQSISPEEAEAEGMWYCDEGKGAGFWGLGPDWRGSKHVWGEGSVDCFQRYWERINGRESWASNPWVWVIGFDRIKPPLRGRAAGGIIGR